MSIIWTGRVLKPTPKPNWKLAIAVEAVALGFVGGAVWLFSLIPRSLDIILLIAVAVIIIGSCYGMGCKT